MSDRYDTYGWLEADLDAVADAVGQALEVPIEPRSSLYRGEYYNWRGTGKAHIVLQENVVEEADGLPTDDEFPDHAVLLYASNLPREWFDRIAAVPGAQWLRSRTGS
jgi:hypothetical protein